MDWFQSIQDIGSQRERISRNRYGLIVTNQGQLEKIQFRPWPKLISIPEVTWLGAWKHQRGDSGDCRLFYNQPLAHSNYLTLSYIESSWQSGLKNFHLALQILDLVALVKRSDAILCEVTNSRISDRLFRRWGWEPHIPHARRRHWIKRFYGNYASVELQHLLQERRAA